MERWLGRSAVLGEYYAYYQWFYNLPSAEIVKKIPVDFLMKAYPGLHNLDLELAYKLINLELEADLELTDDEKIDNVAARVLKRVKPALLELAK